MTHRHILNAHGLRLQYDPKLHKSFASKTYYDEGKGATLAVAYSNHEFTFTVSGIGTWRTYFDKEVLVLIRLLRPFGTSKLITSKNAAFTFEQPSDTI